MRGDYKWELHVLVHPSLRCLCYSIDIRINSNSNAMESTCTYLLGVFDSSCPSPHLSPYENKIGGYPVSTERVLSLIIINSPIQDCYASCPLSLPVCSVCGGTLCLLVQVYCPLENTSYHRTIHLFCCVQPSCHKNNKK